MNPKLAKQVHIGFGKENAPEFAAQPINPTGKLRFRIGGDKPLREHSAGGNVGHIEYYIGNPLPNVFTAKIVSSQYMRGWGMYPYRPFKTFEGAKAWILRVYAHLDFTSKHQEAQDENNSG